MSMSKKDYDGIGSVMCANYMAARRDVQQLKRLDTVVLGLADLAARGDSTFDLMRWVRGCVPHFRQAEFLMTYVFDEVDLFTPHPDLAVIPVTSPYKEA